jgi:hypothetical protein
MSAVGFEPTRIAPPELESGALDRSAKLTERSRYGNSSDSMEYQDAVSPKNWTHWDLNPGPSACEADVIPLHHEPHVQLSHTGLESVTFDTKDRRSDRRDVSPSLKPHC